MDSSNLIKVQQNLQINQKVKVKEEKRESPRNIGKRNASRKCEEIGL
jgi:hypothetical protein